jgi:hypothetical protein
MRWAPWAGSLFLTACGSSAATPDATPVVVDAPIVADAATCAPTPAGLGARWRGEGNANDDLGLYNGSANNVFYQTGKHGLAFLLQGTGDVVADFGDVLWPTGSFSIETWIKSPNAPAGTAYIFDKYGCGGIACDGNDWEIDVDASGHAVFGFAVNGSASGLVTLTDTTGTVADNNWHHIVGVRDVPNAQARLYVDGAVAATKAISGPDLGAMGNVDNAADPVTIGARLRSGTGKPEGFFTGDVDDVAYFTSALTDGEVAAIYAAPDGECH